MAQAFWSATDGAREMMPTFSDMVHQTSGSLPNKQPFLFFFLKSSFSHKFNLIGNDLLFRSNERSAVGS